jgi:nitrogen-specific signal transduction histidine kinase
VGSSFGDHSSVRLLRAAPLLEPSMEEASRSALETSPHPILIADSEHRLCFANVAAVLLLGTPLEQILRRDPSDFLVTSDHTALRRVGCAPRQLAVQLPDGRPATAHVRTLRDRFERPTHLCIELEAQTGGSTHTTLDAVGRLAGELAHDINNQLSAALNYVFVLQRRLAKVDGLANHLEELHGAAWHAATLADSLKLMARRRSAEAESIDLHEIVNTLAPLLRHLLDDTVIEFRLDCPLPDLHAPRAYAEQLVVMLALSAVRRGGPGSRLTVQTSAIAPHTDGTIDVRLSFELHDPYDVSRRARLAGAGTRSPHGGLRRAIKHCRARLGHDSTRIWVDL